MFWRRRQENCATFSSIGLKLRDDFKHKMDSRRKIARKQRYCIVLGVVFCVMVPLQVMLSHSDVMKPCFLTDDFYSWYVIRPLKRLRPIIKSFTGQNSHASKLTDFSIERLLTDCRALPENSENLSDRKQRINLNSSEKIYFTVNSGKYDRLGNKLFQCAALIGLSLTARDRGFCAVPVIQDGTPLDELLEKLHHIRATKISPLNNTMGLVEEDPMKYSPNLLKDIKGGANYTISRYLQSWKYFERFSSVIRKMFKFNDNILKEVNRCLQNIVEQFDHPPTLVGVHVRNLLNEDEVSRGYTRADAAYLNRALDFYRRKFTNVVFVLTSDDIYWAMKNVRGHDIRYSVGFSPEADMALLSMCNHSVITSGTFGWWAGWLTGGSVVYYKDFPRPNSWLGSICSREDYYPKHWLGKS